MITELTMPQMGYDMQEGTVVRWLKAEGSQVTRGEPIAEIETDKAVVEFQSYADGMLQRILVQEGGTVPVGQAIALVGDEADLADLPEPVQEQQPQEEDALVPSPEEPEEDPSVAGVPEPAAPSPDRGRVRASPVARKIAEERGIDLALVVGTGPGGRVTREDVEAHPAPTRDEADHPAEVTEAPSPETAGVETGAEDADTVPLSRMRQQIARVTVHSKSETPHFYVSTDVDMTRAMEMRAQINSSPAFEGAKVSVNDLILKACVEALRNHPKFNATFTPDGILMHEHINIAMAIAGDDSLIVPAIKDAHTMSLREIAVASRDLAQRARGGTITADEYTSGTFSVSNLGMFEVSGFAAIIHPPQAAVIAVGSVAKRPVVRGDRIEIAEIMTATVSADHRIVDGAEGALFIGEVKSHLENPYRLLV